MYIHEYIGMSHRRYLDCPICVEIIKYWIKILNAFKIRIGRTLKNMLKVKQYQHHHQHQLGLTINCFKFLFIVDSVISTQSCTSELLGNTVRTFHIDIIKNNVVFFVWNIFYVYQDKIIIVILRQTWSKKISQKVTVM